MIMNVGDATIVMRATSAGSVVSCKPWKYTVLKWDNSTKSIATPRAASTNSSRWCPVADRVFGVVLANNPLAMINPLPVIPDPAQSRNTFRNDWAGSDKKQTNRQHQRLLHFTRLPRMQPSI